MRISNLFLAVLAVLFFQVNIFSADYYVSLSGSDATGTGTSAAPYATLAKVFTAKDLNAGDIVHVLAGTYNQSGILVGSDDNGFTIQGDALTASGQPTTIFSGGSANFGIALKNSFNDNIVFKNLKLQDYIATSSSGTPYGGGGVRIQDGCTGTIFYNCFFDNCDALIAQSQGGAIFSEEPITVYDSRFTGCFSAKYGGAISIYRGAASDMTVSDIIRCKFSNNNNDGSAAGNDGTALSYSSAYDYTTSTTNLIRITNCLFNSNGDNTNSGSGAIYIQKGKGLITNCTITANSGKITGGIYNTAYGKLQIVNCILYNNSNYNSGRKDIYNNTFAADVVVQYTQLTSNTSYNSVTMSNAFYGDPSFLGGSGSDPYSLSTSSACINRGTLTNAPSNDILTNLRTGNPDLGAYESISSGSELPIELLSFSGVCNGGNVLLNWTTATEWNNAYFTIVRSVNGMDMEIIATVSAAGNSTQRVNYSFQDVLRSNEEYFYYELYQTDVDGTMKLVESVAVKNCMDNSDWDVSLSEGAIKCDFSKLQDVYAVELFNEIGQRIGFWNIDSNAQGIQILPLTTISSSQVVIALVHTKEASLSKKVTITYY